MMRVTILYAAVGLAALCLTACSEGDDADRIARAITAIEEGIEEKSSGSVLDNLAENFRTENGMQRKQIQGVMFYQFRRYPRIEILITNRDIRVQGEQADVTLDALVMGGKTLLPEQGSLYAVSMRWHRNQGQWLLSRIKWRKRTGS